MVSGGQCASTHRTAKMGALVLRKVAYSSPCLVVCFVVCFCTQRHHKYSIIIVQDVTYGRVVNLRLQPTALSCARYYLRVLSSTNNGWASCIGQASHCVH